jgi:hypothetical protein
VTPADLYRTCKTSACRLETLQHYTVPGDEGRQQAFHAGLPLPSPGQGKQDSLKLITELRERGRKISRVHVVDRPLSGYVRYELAVYAENVTAGEDVRIADRSQHPALAALTHDFAIFDGQTVILFDYDSSGRVGGYRIANAPETIRRCLEQYDLAFTWSVPLAEFTTVSRPAE